MTMTGFDNNTSGVPRGGLGAQPSLIMWPFCTAEQAVRLGGRHNMPPPLLTVGSVCVVCGQELPICVPNLKVIASSVTT